MGSDCVWCDGTGFVPLTGVMCRTCGGSGQTGTGRELSARTIRDLDLRYADHASAAGDFGARVALGCVLVLPRELEAVGDGRLHSALEFLSYAASFPTSVAHVLGWTPEEAVAAASRLRSLLAPHADLAVLDAEPSGRRAYGALPLAGGRR